MQSSTHVNAGAAAPRTIVFVGPSFPASRVRELIPTADVRPPIRRGDIALIKSPAIVGIIDGVFDAALAVSPSEIRNAIAQRSHAR